MVHTLRTNYGWKDEYMVDKIQERGIKWLQEQYRICKENELDEWRILKSVLPLARTPMGKKAGRAMAKHEKEMDKMLVSFLCPWKDVHAERVRMYKEKYGIKPGEIAIVDTGDGVAQALKGNDENVKIVRG